MVLALAERIAVEPADLVARKAGVFPDRGDQRRSEEALGAVERIEGGIAVAGVKARDEVTRSLRRRGRIRAVRRAG